MSEFSQAVSSVRNKLDFIEPFSKQMYYSVNNSDLKRIMLLILEDNNFSEYFDVNITIKNLQNRIYNSNNVTNAKRAQGRLIDIRYNKHFKVGIFAFQNRDFLTVDDGIFIDFPDAITDRVIIKCSDDNIIIEIRPELLALSVYKSLFFKDKLMEFDTPEEATEYIDKLFHNAQTLITIKMNYAGIIKTMRKLNSDGILRDKSEKGIYAFTNSSDGYYGRIVQIHNIMQKICRH